MRLTRTSSGVAGALLVTFHGWLLASQFMDGRLAEPWLALRWVVAAVLVATLMALRRQGSGLLSRRAVAVWVLAALLHGPAVLSRSGDPLHNGALAESTVVLQIAGAGTALVLALWLLGALRPRRGDRLAYLRLGALECRPVVALAGVSSPPFAPRPPPRS